MVAADSLLGWDEILRFGTVAAVVWSAAWFLFNQQLKIKDLVHKKFDELKTVFSDKLQYHERHDDVRFDNLSKDIIDLRIANARTLKQINGNKHGDSIRN